MRATVHLMTARDALAVRPVVQSVLERGFLAHFGKVDRRPRPPRGVRPRRGAGRRAAAHPGPPGRRARRALAGRRTPTTLGYAASYLVPLVQVPPRGLWGRSRTGRADHAGVLAGPSTRHRIRRRTGWSCGIWPPSARRRSATSRCGPGSPAMREVVDRLRPGLRVFRSAAGTELLRRAGRARCPAPTCRRRRGSSPSTTTCCSRTRTGPGSSPDGRRVPLPPGNGAAVGTVLVDGVWSATWRTERAGDPGGRAVPAADGSGRGRGHRRGPAPARLHPPGRPSGGAAHASALSAVSARRRRRGPASRRAPACRPAPPARRPAAGRRRPRGRSPGAGRSGWAGPASGC